MILVSGFNVYPNEIEDVVMTHPGVHEVGAVGVPDAKSGEAVKIVVVRKDAAVTDAEIIAHCRQHLTGYKTPRHVEFRDTLPRSPIGKILRRELKERRSGRPPGPKMKAEGDRRSQERIGRTFAKKGGSAGHAPATPGTLVRKRERDKR